MKDECWSRAPWNLRPSLKEEAEEAGVNFDSLIAGLRSQQSDWELSQVLGVSEKTVRHLRRHFERYGIHSIMGQD